MGNRRNKKYAHISRGKYLPTKQNNLQCATNLLEGRPISHIINLNQLASFIDDISTPLGLSKNIFVPFLTHSDKILLQTKACFNLLLGRVLPYTKNARKNDLLTLYLSVP